MNRPARIILLLGAPGSGKGTQSAFLASHLDIPAISTGAMLREQAKESTPVGFRLRQLLATGALIDDRTICDAVASRIDDLRNSSERLADGVILDGFPRTLHQARTLDRLMEDLGLAIPLVLHFEVPQEVLRRRLAGRRQCARCGAIYNLRSGRSAMGSRCEIDGGAIVERDDDSEGVVSRRLAAYARETLPVVDYYRACDGRGAIYRTVDGNRSPGEIAKELRDVVGFVDTAVAA